MRYACGAVLQNPDQGSRLDSMAVYQIASILAAPGRSLLRNAITKLDNSSQYILVLDFKSVGKDIAKLLAMLRRETIRERALSLPLTVLGSRPITQLWKTLRH